VMHFGCDALVNFDGERWSNNPMGGAYALRGLAFGKDGRLWAVVNDGGTGKEARVPGVDVAGKTSTVQVIGQKSWLDSMTLPFEQRDHAWFASFAPAFDPKLVVIVFVEHGGKGSHVAAPVARALYETFFHVRPADESPDVLAAIAAQNDR